MSADDWGGGVGHWLPRPEHKAHVEGPIGLMEAREESHEEGGPPTVNMGRGGRGVPVGQEKKRKVAASDEEG